MNSILVVLICAFFIAFLLFIHSRFDDLDQKHIFAILSAVAFLLILIFDFFGMGIFS